MPELPDVHKNPDTRGIRVDFVGVEGIKVPVCLAHEDGPPRAVALTLSIYSDLDSSTRAVHMSRFYQLISRLPDQPRTLGDILVLSEQVISDVGGAEAQLQVAFDYYRPKKSPASRLTSYSWYPVMLFSHFENDRLTAFLQVTVTYTSACPCSREISEFGAHNQRGQATVLCELKESVDLDRLLTLLDNAGSCEIFNVLKRPDEKMVTERAFQNPRFVEDVSREIARVLRDIPQIGYFWIRCVHQESIHQYDAASLLESEISSSSEVTWPGRLFLRRLAGESMLPDHPFRPLPRVSR